MTGQNKEVKWIGTSKAAQHLDMSVGSLATLRCLGRGPKFYRMGRRIIYKQTDLDAFLEESVCDPALKPSTVND